MKAEWLLHLDPKATLRQIGGRIEATLGAACLDVHRLAPPGGRLGWGMHDVAKPEVEPFTFRQTLRIVYEPPFAGHDATLLTLLHVRASSAPPLAGMEAEIAGHRVHAAWLRNGTRAALDWDLDRRSVVIR